jgi:replicative DNA helicase
VKEKSQKPEKGSALEDILKTGDFGQLNEDRLYRNMERLYGKRAPIEVALCARKKRSPRSRSASGLYDLAST